MIWSMLLVGIQLPIVEMAISSLTSKLNDKKMCLIHHDAL
jgi:hypothetical protein